MGLTFCAGLQIQRSRDSVFVNLSLGESKVYIDEIPSTYGFFMVKANGFRENKSYRMVRIFHKTDLEIDQINGIINDFSRDVDSILWNER